MLFRSGVYKQTYKHLRSIHKPVEPCLATFTIHGQWWWRWWQSEGKCPWPWMGLTKAAQGKADLCPIVTQMWMKSGNAFGKPVPGIHSKEKSVGTAVLLVLVLTLGAFLLHLIYCEGPTLSSAWCCHLQAERGVSFCRHLVTTEPANQSGCPVVAALSLGSRTDSRTGYFVVSCGRVVLSQTNYTVQGRESIFIQCIFGNPFTEKTVVLRVKGRLWKLL